jgi:hypothetical protein
MKAVLRRKALPPLCNVSLSVGVQNDFLSASNEH